MSEQFMQVSEDDTSKITIQDVATALGISKTTVSRAISGKGRIGEATRSKVLDYIETHGYKPNPMAKGLAQQRTFNIGWVMPGDSSITELPFFQSCMSGVLEEAAANDYDVILSIIYENDITGLERMVKGNKVDGVILGRTLISDPNVRYLKESGIPFVVIGSSNEEDVVQVDNDHINACESLTTALIDKGLKNIVVIGGNDNHVVNLSRRTGFERAVSKKSVDNNIVSKICMNADNTQSVNSIVDEALENKVECIICMDDKICTLVLDKLREDDVSIPSTIKVASFYNSELIKNARPRITAIQYSPKLLGHKACSTLLDYINGEKVPMKTLMQYEVLLKGSTE